MSDLQKRDAKDVIMEKVVLGGDLSKLTPGERVAYYGWYCESLGLNPLTKPFDLLSLNGKLVLYAKRDATEQLRKINGVSVFDKDAETTEGVYVVTVKLRDKTGREDIGTGAVPIDTLKGEARANAMMKAETKAKRRGTLSICGLGVLDESEVDSIPGAIREPVDITPETDSPKAKHREVIDLLHALVNEGKMTNGQAKQWATEADTALAQKGPDAMAALAKLRADLDKVGTAPKADTSGLDEAASKSFPPETESKPEGELF